MNDYYHITEQNSINLKALLNAYQNATDENIICSITDVQGNIIYANKKFCEISQYRVEELIGKNHNIVNASFHSVEFFNHMWDTIKSGSVWRGEVKNRAKDGSFYWLESVIIPIKDADDVVQQYLSLRILINDKKKAEEDAARHIKELEELLFILSHEVRQPVANIQGIANLFERHIDHPEELRKLVHLIQQSARILDDFTKKLTLFVHELEVNERTQFNLHTKHKNRVLNK
ncbi:MAG: PAS domain S-box protein [Bacteroidetes bacterium]|nr:PAS domain S-box protein [Bacteroidota bacterium]